MTTLDDAFHKLERGKKHLADLYQHIIGVFDKNKIGLEIKTYSYPKPSDIIDLRPWTAYTVYFSFVPVIDKADGILLGETLQNFRSSLDYLAWALVTNRSRSALTEKQKRLIAFPMARSRRSFWSRVDQLLPNVPTDQRAFIEWYQPYRRSDAGRAMRYLRILSDTDKHRIIVPTMMWPESGDINFKYPKGAELVKDIRHLSTKGEIMKGTKIMTIVLAGVSPNQRHVRVATKTSIMPMFPKSIVRPTPPNDVVLMEDTLNSIRDICSEILAEAKKYF